MMLNRSKFQNWYSHKDMNFFAFCGILERISHMRIPYHLYLLNRWYWNMLVGRLAKIYRTDVSIFLPSRFQHIQQFIYFNALDWYRYSYCSISFAKSHKMRKNSKWKFLIFSLPVQNWNYDAKHIKIPKCNIILFYIF